MGRVQRLRVKSLVTAKKHAPWATVWIKRKPFYICFEREQDVSDDLKSFGRVHEEIRNLHIGDFQR